MFKPNVKNTCYGFFTLKNIWSFQVEWHSALQATANITKVKVKFTL